MFRDPDVTRPFSGLYMPWSFVVLVFRHVVRRVAFAGTPCARR